MINRGRKSTGGELLVPPPTFTEALLMEILSQTIPEGTPLSDVKRILKRAGLTEDEIKERIG